MNRIKDYEIFDEIREGSFFKFESIESFKRFNEYFGTRTGLFVDENFYNENLMFFFYYNTSTCTDEGYNKGSIELNWKYSVTQADNSNKIVLF